MARILYLVHRLPYPPNRGNKVRSYHLLRHLAERHEALLGTFVDDPEDKAHLGSLRQRCVDVKAVRLHPRRAKVGMRARSTPCWPNPQRPWRWVSRHRHMLKRGSDGQRACSPWSRGFPRAAQLQFA